MKYICLFLVSLFCLVVNAQSAKELSQAKIDYKNKEYSKALPVFRKEYQDKPNDPSVNLWYGVCLVETGGDPAIAEECLSLAAKKNLPEAYLYLSDIYVKQYRISEAEQLHQRFLKARPKDKGMVEGDRSDNLEKMKQAINRTQDVEIIDSIIIDKSKFLDAYNLSAEAGSLIPFADIFGSSVGIESVVYRNGKDTEAYYGKPDNGKMRLFQMEKLLNGYGNEKKLSPNNFGLTGDTNYPFVLPDGVTVYFSAKDENGLGGYDIYITRRNLNNDTYLTPERLNMPFNSPANDYLMVIDEYKGIGWFASDRFLPEDKVCVYTFIPNETMELLESDDELYLENRARLNNIQATWKGGKDYRRLIQLGREKPIVTTEKKSDFWFIINDQHTYHWITDFRSNIAKGIFNDVKLKKEELNKLETELDKRRSDFSGALGSERNKLADVITQLEARQEKLNREIEDLEVHVRNEEIKSLK